MKICKKTAGNFFAICKNAGFQAAKLAVSGSRQGFFATLNALDAMNGGQDKWMQIIIKFIKSLG